MTAKKLLVLVFVLINLVANSQTEVLVIDSFELVKNQIENNYQLEYSEFNTMMHRLEKYGDIHQYVLENLDSLRRTPGMHTYYCAFLTFICREMDDTYRNEILSQIKHDQLPRHLAYPLLNKCVFNNDEEVCNFLNGLEKENYILTNEKNILFESMMELRKNKCKTID